MQYARCWCYIHRRHDPSIFTWAGLSLTVEALSVILQYSMYKTDGDIPFVFCGACVSRQKTGRYLTRDRCTNVSRDRGGVGGREGGGGRERSERVTSCSTQLRGSIGKPLLKMSIYISPDLRIVVEQVPTETLSS